MSKAAKLSHPATMRRYLRVLRKFGYPEIAAREAFVTCGAVSYWRKRDAMFDTACRYYSFRCHGLCRMTMGAFGLNLPALFALVR